MAQDVVATDEFGTIKECEGCGREGYSTFSDPEHPPHHPDNRIVTARILTEAWRPGENKLLCGDCR